MVTAATQYKYVSEVVWLPTYLAVSALTFGFFGNGPIAWGAVIFALIACRMTLELLYRIAFGDVRLRWHVGAIAFASQLLIWGLLWVWFAKLSET
jgi:hypothetical protein